MLRHDSAGYFFQLTVLAAVWGASFLFLRIAAPEFGPLSLIFIRSLVAALTLLPLIVMSAEYKKVLVHWRMFLWLGAVTVALPFSLFAYVTLHIPAGSTSLLNTTTTLFSAVVAWIWLRESISPTAIVGIVFGFVGVYVLSAGGNDGVRFAFLPVCAALVAASMYAYGTCFARKYLGGFKAATVAAGCQLGSTLLLLPLGLYCWPEASPSLNAWVSSILLGVFCTAVALIMYFHLIKKVGVTKTVSVTYLIPVFGIVWGAVFLDERISYSMLGGGVLVLLGVALAGRKS